MSDENITPSVPPNAVVTEKKDEESNDNLDAQDSNPNSSDSDKKNQETGNSGAPALNRQDGFKGLEKNQTQGAIKGQQKHLNRGNRRIARKDDNNNNNNDNLAESGDEAGEDFDLDFDVAKRQQSINLTKLEFENMVFIPYSKNWDEDETSSKRGMESGIDYNGSKFSSQKQILDAYQNGLFGSNQWSLKIYNQLTAALSSIISVRNGKSRRSSGSNDNSEEKTNQTKRRKLYGTSIVCFKFNFILILIFNFNYSLCVFSFRLRSLFMYYFTAVCQSAN